jgi:uncharacterized repeat protein (TIGR01451 family)
MRMSMHRSAAAFALALAVLFVGAGYSSLLVAGGRGPNLGVHILRPGSDWRALIVPGQTITIDVGVSNLRGDAAAHDTALTVHLPSGLSLKVSRPAPDKSETAEDGSRLTWNLGVMEAGAFPRMFDLDVQAAADLKRETELAVEASVSTTDKVVDEGNTRSNFVLLVENGAASLVIQSNLDSVPFTVDSPVDFTVEVTNLGTVLASACVLKMSVPPRATFTSSDPASAASGNVVTWELGDIAPAQSQSVKVEIALDQILGAAAFGFAPKLGSLNFKFDATTTTGIFNPGDGHLEIARRPEPAGSNVAVALNVAGAEYPGVLPVGRNATFEIIYGNFGNAPASKATVALTLPKGLDLVDATPAVAHSNSDDPAGASVASWDLGDLPVGESGVIRSHIHVTAIGADGSLVSAAIAAEGNDVPSRKKTAYSLQRAAKSDTHVAGALPREAGPPRGGARRPWVVWIAVIVLVAVVVLAIVRAISKRNLNT